MARILAACLRKELKIHLTDLTHFVAMIFMPLVLILVLTHALETSYSAAIGNDDILVAGNVEVVEKALGSDVKIKTVSEDDLRDRVRQSRDFFGLVGQVDHITIVGDPAFPGASTAMYRLLRSHAVEVSLESSQGTPIDPNKRFTSFNYTVPAFTVMFLFFLAAFTGFAFYGDVINGAWLRIRTSGVPSVIPVVGKVLASIVVGILQLTVLFGLGTFVLGIDFKISQLPALMILGLSICTVATTFGVMLTGLTRTARQMNQLNHLCLLIFGALGGALVPLAAMPKVIQDLSFLTPHYWALKGFRDVMFRDGGFSSVPGNVWPLVAMAVLFLAVGLFTLRYSRLSKAIY